MRLAATLIIVFCLILSVGSSSIRAQSSITVCTWEANLTASHEIPEGLWQTWDLSSSLPIQEVTWMRASLSNSFIDTISRILYLGHA